MRFYVFFFLVASTTIIASCTSNVDGPQYGIKNINEMKTSYEKDNNTTATYYEAIDFYKALDQNDNRIQVNEFGSTDSGHPLHEVVISISGEFDPENLKASGKAILFINNAIHPGEPCGVDASMMLARDYLADSKRSDFLENIVLVIVPVYNIGGALNRNSTTRTNQLGPESYGFRGNAKNLDLNRDFIKCDSKNAQSFNKLFNKWNPEVMIDNHTSNGADYQYTMTLIATQKDRLAREVSNYMVKEMLPSLYDAMKAAGWEMTPYVYARNTPDEGIAGFLDLSRYSSGYGALHNTISFMPETHMLKPYSGRVQSTYSFMDCMVKKMHIDYKKIIANKRSAVKSQTDAESLPLSWGMDFDKVDTVVFKGYTAKYKPSEITGHSRLYYDRNEPFEKEVPFYNNYKVLSEAKVAKAYIIPQAYEEVIERLQWNGVKVERIEKDTSFDVEMYYIKDFKTSEDAYEGHYLHSNIKLDKRTMQWGYFKGDYIIPTDQDKRRYIFETLEPNGPDSYFAWNFFDGILMQKEYFSPYVFEDLAVELLKSDTQLKEKLEKKKKEDKEFAQNGRAQLRFIYENSPHYEKTHRLYPVGRIP